MIKEAAADGISGVISGLSFSQPSKKPKLATSDFQDKRRAQLDGQKASIKNKFNAMRKKRIAEALAYGERDPTQRRLRSGQDNTPSPEVGVKGSQTVPTRDLNDESGNNQKIDRKIKIMPGDKQLVSTNCGMESGKNSSEKKKLKEQKYDIISDTGSKESGYRRIVPSIENNQESGKQKRIKKIKESLESELYKWRTQKDDKVRDLHRDLEGKIFNKNNPPVSGTNGFRGNPGEPANCRCFAEPIVTDFRENINIINKLIEHLNKEGTKACLFK